MLQIREKLTSLVFSIALIVIAGLFYNLIMISPILVPKLGEGIYLWILMGSIMFLGFYYLPNKITKYTEMYAKESPVFFNLTQAVIILGLILLLNYGIIKSNEVYFEFWIALFEEILFRYIIFRVLRKNYSNWQSILIGSILFGVILHINGDWLANIIVKVPSGMILYWLAQKSGIQSSIGLHWLYNIVVSKL